MPNSIEPEKPKSIDMRFAEFFAAAFYATGAAGIIVALVDVANQLLKKP